MSDVMLSISGIFYDGKTSRAQHGELWVLRDGSVKLVCSDASDHAINTRTYDYSSLQISSRLGNTARYIDFPAGGKFETLDNAAVDCWQRQFDRSWRAGLAHALENQWRMIAASVCIVLATLWLFISYGIPAISTFIAGQLPQSISRQLGDGVLETLDEHVFSASQLDASRQQQLQQLFAHYFASQIEALNLSLQFRSSEQIGANAFALPSGDLIFTDAIVNLAGDDRELLAVMAHEVGHMVHRHMLRRAIQDSFLVVAVAMIAGDVSNVSSLIVAAPTLLAEMAYSRSFEREADQYSLVFMRSHHIDPVYFSNMMQRLHWQELSSEVAARQNLPESDVASNKADDKTWRGLIKNLHYYLSSHPGWDQRMEAFGKPTITWQETPAAG